MKTLFTTIMISMTLIMVNASPSVERQYLVQHESTWESPTAEPYILEIHVEYTADKLGR